MTNSLVRIGRILFLTAAIIVAIATLRGTGFALPLFGWCLFSAFGYFAARRGTLDYWEGRCELPLWLVPAVLATAAALVPVLPAPGVEFSVLLTRVLIYGAIAALFVAAIYYYTALQDTVPYGHHFKTEQGSWLNLKLFFLALLHSVIGLWKPELVIFTSPETYPPVAWSRLFAVDVMCLMLLKDAVLAATVLPAGGKRLDWKPALELCFWLFVLGLICKNLAAYSASETARFVAGAALLYASVSLMAGTAARRFSKEAAEEAEAAKT